MKVRNSGKAEFIRGQGKCFLTTWVRIGKGVQEAEGPSGPRDIRYLWKVPPPHQERLVALGNWNRFPPTAPWPVLLGEHETVEVDVLPRLRIDGLGVLEGLLPPSSPPPCGSLNANASCAPERNQ
jgi:hypothetical protein